LGANLKVLLENCNVLSRLAGDIESSPGTILPCPSLEREGMGSATIAPRGGFPSIVVQSSRTAFIAAHVGKLLIDIT
jgi:hypothetical protein